jgi:hypothetical protein
MKTIKTEKDILSYLSAENQEQAKRHLYKSTECGAWISFEEKGITLGSIVEGADYGIDTDALLYPFTSKEFEETIAYIECEAESAWIESNQ